MEKKRDKIQAVESKDSSHHREEYLKLFSHYYYIPTNHWLDTVDYEAGLLTYILGEPYLKS